MDAEGRTNGREAARQRAGTLMVRTQSDELEVDEEIATQLAAARRWGWDDVELALLHVRVVHNSKRQSEGVDEMIEEFRREAQRREMPAMEAVAIIDGIRHLRSTGSKAPFRLYAAAHRLLSQPAQPARDRLSGLINLALEFDAIGLTEMAGESLRHAVEVARQIPCHGEALAVIVHNQAQRAYRRIAVLVMEGDVETARLLIEQVDEAEAAFDGVHLPPSWFARLRAHRALVEALVADEEIDPDDARHIAATVSAVDHEYALLLRLATPLGSQTSIPEPATLDGLDRPELGWFLRVRSLLRGEGDPNAVMQSMTHFNRVLLDRAAQARVEMESGMVAIIEAHLLADERGELIEQALTDPLTSLRNRRAFEQALVDADGSMTTLILLDLDNFKMINDEHGHHVGDLVLERCARLLDAATEAVDSAIVARIGGDEFAVLLAGDDVELGREVAARIECSLASASWPSELTSVPSASTGVSVGCDRTELFQAADDDLYENKNSDTRSAMSSTR